MPPSQDAATQGFGNPVNPGDNIKLCRRCNQHKPLTQFYRSKANVDGYDGRCKACDAVQCAERRKRKRRVEVSTSSSPINMTCCHRHVPDSTTLWDGQLRRQPWACMPFPCLPVCAQGVSWNKLGPFSSGRINATITMPGPDPCTVHEAAAGSAGAHGERQGLPQVQRHQGRLGVLPQQDQPGRPVQSVQGVLQPGCHRAAGAHAPCGTAPGLRENLQALRPAQERCRVLQEQAHG